MTSARRSALVLSVLVAILVVGAYLLRVRSDAPTAASPTPSAPSASGEASIEPSPNPSTPSSASPTSANVAFLGDALTVGTGASSAATRWSSLLAAEQGWTERNFAHPGIGFAATSTDGSCPAGTCPAYLAQVPEVIAAAPSVVVITTGAADMSLAPDTVKSAVTQTLSALRAGLPKASIVVIGPWSTSALPDTATAYSATLQQAAAASGAVFVDTGQVLTGKPELVTADSTPTDAGHAALAAAVASALRLAQVPGVR